MLKYEETDFCRVSVEYVAEPDDVILKWTETEDEVIKETQKLRLPGFRKGKATREAVKFHFNKQIKERVKQKLISQASDEYIYETKAKILFYPQIEQAEIDKDYFHCRMSVLKRPDFELGEYKGFKIPKPHYHQSAEELTQKTLQDLRVQHGEIRPFSEGDFVMRGDKITCDMECLINGNDKVPEFTKEGMIYDVGSGLYSQIDEEILGCAVGETREFVGKYDENTPANFKITVHMGMRTDPAPLDDSLAERAGFKDYNELENTIRSMSKNQIEQWEKQQIKKQINLQLLNNHQFQVPEFLVNAEVRNILKQYGAEEQKQDSETLEQLKEEAVKRVRLSFIFDKVKDQEADVVFSTGELLNMLKGKLEDSGQNVEEMIDKLQKDGSLYGILAAMESEIVQEFLVKNCEIVE